MTAVSILMTAVLKSQAACLGIFSCFDQEASGHTLPHDSLLAVQSAATIFIG
jgi:hypothetical protein